MVGCALTAHLKDDLMTRMIVEACEMKWPDRTSPCPVQTIRACFLLPERVFIPAILLPYWERNQNA